MQCVKCGAEMDQTEKDTSSGRDIREYACRSCGHTDWEVLGPALWKILHEDREEAEAEKAVRDAENRPAEPVEIPPGTMWTRLVARLAGLLRGKP
jgi:cytochrome c551/c552